MVEATAISTRADKAVAAEDQEEEEEEAVVPVTEEAAEMEATIAAPTPPAADLHRPTRAGPTWETLVVEEVAMVAAEAEEVGEEAMEAEAPR